MEADIALCGRLCLNTLSELMNGCLFGASFLCLTSDIKATYPAHSLNRKQPFLVAFFIGTFSLPANYVEDFRNSCQAFVSLGPPEMCVEALPLVKQAVETGSNRASSIHYHV